MDAAHCCTSHLGTKWFLAICAGVRVVFLFYDLFLGYVLLSLKNWYDLVEFHTLLEACPEE
ncbi:hypothetical protein D3C85_1682850 [compost metagenome]